MRLLASILSIAMGASALALVLAAGSEEPRRIDLTERVRVDLVQLNFLAMDRKGRPVTDLRAEEIEIIDEGEKQEVAFLQRVHADASVTAGAEAAPAGPAPAAGAPAPAPPGAAGPGRWIVLMFDNYLTSQGTRIKSVQAARQLVEKDLGPADRAAIVAYDGSFDVLQNFTTDRGALMSACDRGMMNLDHAAPDRYSELDTLMDSIGLCEGVSNPALCARPYVEAYADDRIREADRFMTSLLLLVRSLTPIPDIKTLVLFSEGFSREPLADGRDAVTVVLGSREGTLSFFGPSPEIDRAFDRLSEAAAAARVSIFTIDPVGGGRQSSISARQGSPPSEITNGLQLDVYRRSETNARQALLDLSRRTGGTFSQSGDALDALRKVVDLSAGLYTVGYYPTEEATSSSMMRDVRIRVRRKGVDVQTRREVPIPGIYPPLTGELTLSPGACGDTNRRGVVMKLRLDRSKLLFQKVDKNLSSNFSLYIRFLAEGQAEPLKEDYRFFNILITPEDYMAGGLPDPSFEQTLVVPCHPLTVTVTAVDAGSGARGTFTGAIAP